MLSQNFPQNIITEMRDSVGQKDPIEYFKTLTTAFEILFDYLGAQEKELQAIRSELQKVKTQSALAIHWEPKVAADMISKQIDVLRTDKDIYFNEISSFKKAYNEDVVTQNYCDFVSFWVSALGFHPFLEY